MASYSLFLKKRVVIVISDSHQSHKAEQRREGTSRAQAFIQTRIYITSDISDRSQ
jgi:hypothetical protein